MHQPKVGRRQKRARVAAKGCGAKTGSSIMQKLFAYFYLLRGFPKQVQQIVPAHVEYWKAARLADYRGGPFADRSGGLIEFRTSDLMHAQEIAAKDPFVSGGLVEISWVKEWTPE
jgi:uncharacterized protein YciI